MKSGLITTALACSMLFGCATAPKFSEAEFPRNDADLEIMATQQEIESENSATNPAAAGGGLLGVLIASSIDNTRNRRAEEAITPIRDLLIDYPVGERFAERVAQSGIAERLVSGSESRIRIDAHQPEDGDLKRPLVIVEPHVKFKNNMTALLVDLTVKEFEPREQSPGQSPKRGVHQTFRFMWPLETEERLNREEAIAAWSQQSRDGLIGLIDRGMDETLSMLSAHLDEGEIVFADTSNRINIAEPGSFRTWRQAGELTWLANPSGLGPIYAVPQHAIR